MVSGHREKAIAHWAPLFRHFYVQRLKQDQKTTTLLDSAPFIPFPNYKSNEIFFFFFAMKKKKKKRGTRERAVCYGPLIFLLII